MLLLVSLFHSCILCHYHPYTLHRGDWMSVNAVLLILSLILSLLSMILYKIGIVYNHDDG